MSIEKFLELFAKYKLMSALVVVWCMGIITYAVVADKAVAVLGLLVPLLAGAYKFFIDRRGGK